jgi:hypothetical protein
VKSCKLFEYSKTARKQLYVSQIWVGDKVAASDRDGPQRFLVGTFSHVVMTPFGAYTHYSDEALSSLKSIRTKSATVLAYLYGESSLYIFKPRKSTGSYIYSCIESSFLLSSAGAATT